MTPVWAVIRREYLSRVRSKWFVLSTLGVPLVGAVLVFAPLLFGGNGEEARTMVVIDRTGVLHARIEEALADAGYTVEEAQATEEAGIADRVASGEVGGYLLLDHETLERGEARLVAATSPSGVRRLLVRQAIVQAAIAERIGGEGGEVEALMAGGSLEVEILSGDGGVTGASDPVFVTVYGGTFVLYMIVLLYAVAVMRSVIEEKTNRIVEVVVSSMRPWHLMLGKILGVGAVGLTQLAVWTVLGALALGSGLPALLASRPELAGLDGVSAALPGLRFAGLFLLFFLGGYFIFSTLYAGVGAMCNSEQEAQQAQTPLVILLIAPIVLLVGVMQDPGSTTSVALSLVPFFSPILMFARAAMGAAPAWQILLSAVLMAATVVVGAWVAGRIYRTGILMTGKRPTLPELVRWVREA